MGPEDGVPKGLGLRCCAKCPRTWVVRVNGYAPCAFLLVYEGFTFVKFRLNFDARRFFLVEIFMLAAFKICEV